MVGSLPGSTPGGSRNARGVPARARGGVPAQALQYGVKTR